MILYKYKVDYNQILNKLIKTIKISTPTFDLLNYELFIYSPMEIRILMNIALILNKMGYKEKYRDILKFCLENLDFKDKLFPKICHNLAGAYRRNKDFHKSLVYSNMGIESLQKSNSINGLNVLYYGKGIAEYKLGKKEYIETLNISLLLSKTFNQHKIVDSIIDNCKNVFGIDLTL